MLYVYSQTTLTALGLVPPDAGKRIGHELHPRGQARADPNARGQRVAGRPARCAAAAR